MLQVQRALAPGLRPGEKQGVETASWAEINLLPVIPLSEIVRLYGYFLAVIVDAYEPAVFEKINGAEIRLFGYLADALEGEFLSGGFPGVLRLRSV